MPVRKDSEENGEAKYTINNGDLQALNRIKDQYHLRDSDDVITFAIGVLNSAAGSPVSITRQDGTIAKYLPADELKRQEDDQ